MRLRCPNDGKLLKQVREKYAGWPGWVFVYQECPMCGFQTAKVAVDERKGRKSDRRKDDKR